MREEEVTQIVGKKIKRKSVDITYGRVGCHLTATLEIDSEDKGVVTYPPHQGPCLGLEYLRV